MYDHTITRYTLQTFLQDSCKNFGRGSARILKDFLHEFQLDVVMRTVRFVQEFSAGIPAEFLIKILQFRINSCKIIVRILQEFCLKNVRILPEYKNLYWLKNTKFFFLIFFSFSYFQFFIRFFCSSLSSLTQYLIDTHVSILY